MGPHHTKVLRGLYRETINRDSIALLPLTFAGIRTVQSRLFFFFKSVSLLG